MHTVIHVLFAVLSFPARFAFARVVVHQVGTFAVVQAWRRLAIVNVRLAVLAHIARIAVTSIASVQVFALGGTDRAARVRHALLDLCFTVQTQKRWPAFANSSALLSNTCFESFD